MGHISPTFTGQKVIVLGGPSGMGLAVGVGRDNPSKLETARTVLSKHGEAVDVNSQSVTPTPRCW